MRVRQGGNNVVARVVYAYMATHGRLCTRRSRVALEEANVTSDRISPTSSIC
jgi:hypothetical protein